MNKKDGKPKSNALENQMKIPFCGNMTQFYSQKHLVKRNVGSLQERLFVSEGLFEKISLQVKFFTSKTLLKEASFVGRIVQN